MADRFVPAAVIEDWVDDTTVVFNTASGQAGANIAAAVTDRIIFEANSGPFALGTGSTPVCGGLTMTDYTDELNLRNATLDVNGAVTDLGGVGTIIADAGGTIAIGGTGAHTIGDEAGFLDSDVTLLFDAISGNPTLNPTATFFPELPNVTINNGVDSFVVGASTSGLPIAGDFIFTAGKFNTDDNSVKVTHSGTSAFAWSRESEPIYHYEIADGAVITANGNAYVSEFTHGTGQLTGTGALLLALSGDDKWHGGEGTIDIRVVHFTARQDDGVVRKVGAVSLPNVTQVEVGRGRGLRVEQTADWSIGTISGALLRIQEIGDNEHGQLDCAGFNLTVGGDVEIGFTDAGRGGGFLLCGEGVMDWRGDVKIAAGSDAGDDNQNKIEFESSTITLGATKTIDLADIAHTNVSAIVNGGKIDNATFSDATILLHFDRSLPLGTNTGVHAAVYEVMGGTGVYAGGVAA